MNTSIINTNKYIASNDIFGYINTSSKNNIGDIMHNIPVYKTISSAFDKSNRGIITYYGKINIGTNYINYANNYIADKFEIISVQDWNVAESDINVFILMSQDKVNITYRNIWSTTIQQNHAIKLMDEHYRYPSYKTNADAHSRKLVDEHTVYAIIPKGVKYYFSEYWNSYYSTQIDIYRNSWDEHIRYVTQLETIERERNYQLKSKKK